MILTFIQGFYLHEALLPPSCTLPDFLYTADGSPNVTKPHTLLLGPFNGKPACQLIKIKPQGGGVCSAAYVAGKTLLVEDVEKFPNHIACDGETKSEVVIPLILERDVGVSKKERVGLGVLDLDCVGLAGFESVDVEGLERIAELIVKSCEWA